MQLAARYHLETKAECQEVLHADRFPELVARFRALLIRILPDAPVHELWWGMHFVVGAMINTWTGMEVMERLSAGEAVYDGEDEMIRRLVRFSAAGLRSASREGGGGES
jgi:hypothetical protein